MPEPFGPWSATISPRANLERRAIEDREPRAVGEGHALEAEERRARRRTGLLAGRIRREVPRPPLGEPGERLLAGRVQEKPPALDEEHAVGRRQRTLRPLLREDHRRATRDGVEQQLGAARVELRGGLIEKQERGPERERRRQADALELPARELGGAAPAQVLGLESRERIVDAAPDLGRRRPDVLEPERDLVSDEGHHDLILRILEDGRHGARELGGAGAARVEARDLDPAREAAAVEVGNEPRQRAKERGLPRPRRPEERDDLALAELERHVRQRGLDGARIREGQPVDAG